jgi:hypothetical protein
VSLTKTPPDVRRAVLDRFAVKGQPGKFRCAHCGKAFVSSALEIDHIIPEIDSTPEQRSDPANLQPLCAPKGSTRWTSCHKRKSADEATARARQNRVPTDWWPVVRPLMVATVTGGFAYAALEPDALFSPARFVTTLPIIGGIGFCTFLVHNAFRHRAPLEAIPTEPDPEPVTESGLDLERVVAAVREIVGLKGDVTATDENGLLLVSYAGTGFPDHEDEKRLALVDKIAAKIGGRWLPVWDTVRDRVRLSRRPDLPPVIPHPGFAPGRPWHVLPVAEGVSFDLLVTSHLLIVGQTNAGKTALMRGLVAAVSDSAGRGEAELVLADPKQIELLGFRGWPGVRRIITDTEDLWNMAFDIEKEMNERFRLLREEGVPLSSHKRLIVVIDEYEQYFKRMRRYWQTALGEDGKPIKRGGERVPGAIDAIQSILSMARRCGIHLIIGTQSPDATWFGGTGTRENMGGRAAVGPIDGFRSKMMFDDSSWGRDIPAELKGRTTVQVGNGLPEECQVYWVPDPFDPENNLSADDWAILARVGMPKEMVKL